MSKSAKYSAKGDTDSLDELTKRLAVDLRTGIRALGSFPIFSDGWCSMAETCGRIAKVSEMESNLPSAKDNATLWETEEQALRFLIEDGKLNVSMRNLIEYKLFQIDSFTCGQLFSETQRTVGDDFEKGLGSVLRNAWSHVEALQTTDVVELLTYSASIMKFVCDSALREKYFSVVLPQNDLYLRQEVLVFYYLYWLVKTIGEMSESRIMPTIREKHLFEAILDTLLILKEHIPIGDFVMGCKLLALIVDTEDFGTYTNQYFDKQNNENVTKLLQMQEILNKEVVSDTTWRSAVRPLGDFASKIKRFAGSARK